MNITIIGSGNVGSHLFKVFTEKRIHVSAIWSRTLSNAEFINNEIATDKLDFSKSKSNIFIVTVKDDAINSVLEKLKIPRNAILAHTSGSVEMDVLKSKSSSYGIFYPLQTFSKNREIDFSEIPLLIEASNKQTFKELEILALMISKNVNEFNSEKRRQIHLAAVFASNFTNKLLGISKEVLAEQDIDLRILEPLVKETIKKSFELTPEEAQTGPAIRGDKKTIAKHLDMLNDNSENQKLYKLI